MGKGKRQVLNGNIQIQLCLHCNHMALVKVYLSLETELRVFFFLNFQTGTSLTYCIILLTTRWYQKICRRKRSLSLIWEGVLNCAGVLLLVIEAFCMSLYVANWVYLLSEGISTLIRSRIHTEFLLAVSSITAGCETRGSKKNLSPSCVSKALSILKTCLGLALSFPAFYISNHLFGIISFSDVRTKSLSSALQQGYL